MIIRMERLVSLWVIYAAATVLGFAAEPVRQKPQPAAQAPGTKAVRPSIPAPAAAVKTPPPAAKITGPGATASKATTNTPRPVLLYSRYYNAQGETRYLPDGTYKDVLTRLTNDFVVRIHNKPLNKETLAGVNVLMIANPSDKAVGNGAPPPHVGAADMIAVTEWVLDGGGLMVMGNQEDHNLEVKDFNRLLKQFGIQMTNVYTDAKLLFLPATNGLLGSLRWAYYTGNSLSLITDHPARPRALINNDLAQKPAKGTRDYPGILAARSRPGDGRVIVVTDAGWISNDALSGKGIGDVAFKDHDNWVIFQKMMRWLAKHGESTTFELPPPPPVSSPRKK